MRDARALLEAGRYNGAIYLAGYAIECHLKYACCRRMRDIHLPAKLETHRWDDLIEEAGIVADLKSARNMFDLYSALEDRWGPSLRYQTNPYQRKRALQLYNEFNELYEFLRELIP
jgi:HEPN domain-containing protein